MLETPVVATLIRSTAVDTTFNLRRINPKQLGFKNYPDLTPVKAECGL
jgi:hypothetical protein